MASVVASSLSDQAPDISSLAEKWGALGFLCFVMWLLLFRSEKRQDAKDAKDNESHAALVKAVDAFDASVQEMRRVADRQDDIAQQQLAIAHSVTGIRCKQP